MHPCSGTNTRPLHCFVDLALVEQFVCWMMRVFSRGATGSYRGAVIEYVGVFGRTGEGAVQNAGGKLDSTAGVDTGVHAQYGGYVDLATERKKVRHLPKRVVVGLAMRGTASSQAVLMGAVGVGATRSGVSGSAREVFRAKGLFSLIRIV